MRVSGVARQHIWAISQRPLAAGDDELDVLMSEDGNPKPESEA
jgi:hypothetical protein